MTSDHLPHMHYTIEDVRAAIDLALALGGVIGCYVGIVLTIVAAHMLGYRRP